MDIVLSNVRIATGTIFATATSPSTFNIPADYLLIGISHVHTVEQASNYRITQLLATSPMTSITLLDAYHHNGNALIPIAHIQRLTTPTNRVNFMYKLDGGPSQSRPMPITTESTSVSTHSSPTSRSKRTSRETTPIITKPRATRQKQKIKTEEVEPEMIDTSVTTKRRKRTRN